MKTRKIWKSTVVGVGPYIVEEGHEIICTVRSVKHANEIANIPLMLQALKETENYFSNNPSVLKLGREDLLNLIAEAQTYQEVTP